MQAEKITIHAMNTSTGEVVKYARIIQVQELRVLGQSLLLHRLSKNQLMRAIDLSDGKILAKPAASE